MSNTEEITTPELLVQRGYRYVEQIGEGSNGKTYKARNLKTGELVAIKALKFSENLKNYELFAREAEVLKSINTPGTPVFYDYISAEKEFTECWLVQEYVDGESLLDKMEKGEPFGELTTLLMMLQLADIVRMLQTMYTPPIIHRDIKPSNILVRKTPKDGMDLCLIDFGAVANPQRRGLNSTVAGTVGYMAPEQLIGDCTLQSDYYAIGATALHLISGIAPSEFPSDGFLLQFEERLKKTVPSIHKETVELLKKLLATDKSERPQNANELIEFIFWGIDEIDNVKLIKKKLKKRIDVLENRSESGLLTALMTIGTVLIFLICIGKDVGIFGCLLSFIPICFIKAYKAYLQDALKNLRAEYAALPNDSANRALEYKPAISRDTELSSSDNAIKDFIGTVNEVYDDYVECTATLEHRCFAFIVKQKIGQYKIGDKIRSVEINGEIRQI